MTVKHAPAPAITRPQRSSPAWHVALTRQVAIALGAFCLGATPGLAHDAFGDLGPFYASLLHPLADPLQAALIVGTAAFLAGRPLGLTRLAWPVFVGAASLAARISRRW